MKNLQIFKNNDFGEIRTLEEDGRILFCASDVAKALGYIKPNDAVARHCRATTKRSTPISGKMQEINFVPEGDVYRLITHSKLPTAEKFESWVFDEVLPSIRKHGAYMTPETLEKVLLSPDTLMQLAQNLKDEQEKRKELETKIEQDKPKVLFADAVATAQTSILIGELAKLLKQNGVDMGQNRLFEWMRQNGYLIRRQGSDYNMPTQRSMEQGLFEIKETTVVHADGHTHINKTPKVTGKGQAYFVTLFLKEA
ncbi:MAG: phage antirepressor [Negativibacillus massiliensis]|uniref:phage antirepressor n=1 Tax=Negativibacillus massiliensis TaxID=1871035 RepID=UPI0023F57DEE|nr:phage antirepressor [Negativibacillus massiliensis]